MKIYKVIIILTFTFLIFIFSSKATDPNDLSLVGKTIVVDVGHGGKDPGTSYKNILEKDLNLKISKYLRNYLVEYGANVVLTRDGDYDLSSPKHYRRKKSDFDNRITLINKSNAYVYYSIHLNYLSDSSYYGPQIFYNNKFKSNKDIALILQKDLNKGTNTNRKIKLMKSGNYYMYNKLDVPGVLIECGFLSNYYERNLLIKSWYQKKIARLIAISTLKI